MKRKWKRTIRYKITTLILFMLLTALLIMGAVSLWSLNAMRTLSEESGGRLGQTAAEDAQAALAEMAGKRLLGTAGEKAAYIEEKFHTVIASVNGIVQAAEDIYRNPDSYPDREVPLPVKGSRELAVQLLYSEQLKEASGEQLAELLKLGNLQELLKQYNANNDMISSTYLATESGWMLQADYIAYSKYSGESDVPDFYEADTRQWYSRAFSAEQGECIYTDIMEDIHEGRDCIVCAKAVWIDGKVAAVAGIGSYLDTINEAVLNTTIGKSGYAFLVNERGQVIVSGASQGETAAGAGEYSDLRNSKNTILAETAKAMTDGNSGLVKLTLEDREVYLAYAPLKEPDWSFAVVMDVEEVIAPAKESRKEILTMAEKVTEMQDAAVHRTIALFLGLVCCAVVIIGAVSIRFTGKLTEPIRGLTRDVAHINGGCLEGRIHIHTGDEVEELGDAFNRMSDKLQKYINNLAVVTAEKERIRTELSLASRIQADMLPDSDRAFRERKEFKLHTFMMPAKEVGGDFYDFFLTDEDHLAFLIADVSGKGVPAALFMVVAKTLLRSRINGSGTLKEAVEEVNEKLCEGNKNGMFVTAWIGVLTLSTGKVTFVNAGHNPPLFGNSQNGFAFLRERGGFVLGGLPGTKYCMGEFKMHPGDMLFLYTDGVTETTDENGRLYGEGRLRAFLHILGETNPESVIEAVWKDICRFQKTKEQSDDVTMLALCYQSGGSEYEKK